MARTRTRILIAAFAALTVLTTFVALAWACTPSSYITLDREGGPAGSTVTVMGSGFAAGTVEISWSGGGELRTASGPNFSTTVTIPDAPAGVHYVQATARDENGTVIGSPSRAFEVTAPSPSPTPTGAQPGATTEPPAARAPATQPSSGSEPASVSEQSPATRSEKSPTADKSPASSRPKTSGRRQPASKDRGTSRSQKAAPRTQRPTPGVTRTRSGVRVFEDSVGPASPSEVATSAAPSWSSGRETVNAGRSSEAASERGGAASELSARSSSGGPPERSAVGNLWSGFSDGTPRAIFSGASSQVPTRGSEFTPGLVLLGLGLVTLAGGLGLGAVRRRRATASQQR